jgi:aspartyl-tRNA(Asn)/glutamyl-tRNA(Gln) amidotransferase subunit A
VTTDSEVSATGAYNELLACYETARQRRATDPLSGLRVAVNISAADLPLTCGSKLVAVVPEIDATVVSRLLDAGAPLVGKANMDAFAFGPSGEFSDYDPVEKPTYPDRVPGGSSSGSGAAVASGAVDIALGSDTGGSVRIPTSACGVVGMKPTYALVPRHGFVSFAPSLDTIGPLGRDVETVAKTLTVIAGPGVRDPTVRDRSLPRFSEGFRLPENPIVGLPREFFEVTDTEVGEAVRNAVSDSSLSVQSTGLARGAIEEAYFLIRAAEFVWYLDQEGTIRGQGSEYTDAVRELLRAVRDVDLGEHIASRLLPSALLDSEMEGGSYFAARREVFQCIEQVTEALDTVDALVVPTLRTRPPGFGEMESADDMLTLLGNTAPFNLARVPAVSVPVGTIDGVPVAAQVVGPQFSDLQTPAIAEQIPRSD